MLAAAQLVGTALHASTGQRPCSFQDMCTSTPSYRGRAKGKSMGGCVQVFQQYLGIPQKDLARLGYNGGVFYYDDLVVKVSAGRHS